MMVLEENQVYTDLNYGTDIVIDYFDELVVMASERGSGHKNLYRREEFSNGSRFQKK